MAGLSCARALQDADVQVTVFDKSRRPGGRMSTRRGDGWQCDHGAQYFTARDAGFRAEVERWQRAGVVSLWQPRLHVLSGTDRHQPDTALQRFVGTPRMSAVPAFMASGLKTSMQATIQQLQHGPSGWQLRSAEQGWLEQHFDAVVLALPAPQAVPLLQDLLPQLAQLASTTVMRGCWALMLQFAAPVLLPFDAAFVNAGPLRWLARDNSKPGRPGGESWLLHATAEWSEAHLEHDHAEVSALLLRAFAELGGPDAESWSLHRWRYADTAAARTEGYGWDATVRAGLCGDWLNGGKVEGAWLSGRLLAERIVQDL
jgi:predicted NAD/FAD-dependent oxidoreductase